MFELDRIRSILQCKQNEKDIDHRFMVLDRAT